MSNKEIEVSFHNTMMANSNVKYIQDFMQYNCFSLSKTRTAPIFHHYAHNGGTVTIDVTAPEKYGLATIWDADILMFLVSSIRHEIKLGNKPSPTVTFKAADCLRFIGRDGCGNSYKNLKSTFKRLRHTIIATTIKRKGTKYEDFNILDKQEYVEREDGTHLHISAKVADWVYDAAINDKDVLTFNRKYFEISGGLERWLYLTGRKHGGKQSSGFEFTARQLHKKSASTASFPKFYHKICSIIKKQDKDIAANKIPDYIMYLITENKRDPKIKFLLSEHVINGTRTCDLSHTEQVKASLAAMEIYEEDLQDVTPKLRMPTEEDFEEIRKIQKEKWGSI